jgi:hypothetical protein
MIKAVIGSQNKMFVVFDISVEQVPGHRCKYERVKETFLVESFAKS